METRSQSEAWMVFLNSAQATRKKGNNMHDVTSCLHGTLRRSQNAYSTQVHMHSETSFKSMLGLAFGR